MLLVGKTPDGGSSGETLTESVVGARHEEQKLQNEKGQRRMKLGGETVGFG